MLDLSTVCAYACVGSGDRNVLDRTDQVMRYLQKYVNFQDVLMFTPHELDFCSCKQIQIPEFTNTPYGKSWQVFLAKSLPAILLLSSPATHFMFIHEDGFPIELDLWTNEFLRYDYIAAPWADGVVGGGGMSLASRKFLIEKFQLPFYERIEDGNNEDEFACRKHRNLMEEKRIKFAPTELAYRYCTENNGNEKPSFGFHGRKCNPYKFIAGWKKVFETK